MPTISAFYGILIQMFLEGPRAAALSCALRGVEAVVDIRTLEIVDGSLPRRAMALMLEWAQEHRAELMEDWDLCNPNQSPNKIQPLPQHLPFGPRCLGAW
jgi:Domain of unknown function (DUF4160)